jgi:hypothetical protein
VILFPADSKPEQIMHYKPKGVILSNGPGDPQEYEELYLNIRQLLKIGNTHIWYLFRSTVSSSGWRRENIQVKVWPQEC